MWSEHCCYRNSRLLLKNFPTTGPRILVGPGENAGVVDIGYGQKLVFKIESHNHPSAVEPFQGAATGVGGILRDIFTMGARPIALLNALRFGPLEDEKNISLLEGVVAGISHYGNCVGVPTVGGEVRFDTSYAGNPLVNAMALGLMETEVRFSINKKNKKSVQKWLSQHKQIFQNSETVYFDTSKNALRDAGVELRLRRNGKGIKQTIKSVGPNGSLFTRTESEIQLSDFEPKLSHLKKFLTREKLCRIDFARLRPAFRTKVNRTIINNPTKNGMVQSVFDVGEIKADAETQEIMEVEHELKQGSTDTLLETCHEFLDRVPCSIGLEGKAARGYRLVTGEYPEPVFASKISISPDLPLPKAMREILQTSFQHAMTNLPVYLLTGHPESVHQFRVGLRRLRAALSAFAPILHLQNSGGLILQMKSIQTLEHLSP